MDQIFLKIDLFLALTAILINFVFVILVLARTSRSILYIIFVFICISVIFWNLCEFMVYFTGKRFWFYFSLIGSAMIPTLMFHFIVTLVNPEQKTTSWIVPAYVFSGLLALSSPLAIFHSGFQRLVESGYWDISYFILFVPFFLAGIIMLLAAIKGSKSEDEKSQLRYILLADLIGVITVFTDHVQILKVPVFPLGPYGSVFYPSILVIGLFRHRAYYDILAQMRMKLEVLNEISAGIAHEIRNPLSSIKGAAKLLSDHLKERSNSQYMKYFTIITDEIERLNTILTNFQFFTKPIKIEKELVSINEIIQKTVKLAEIDLLNIKIQLDLSDNMKMIQADAVSMKQVFLNLIKNAADACDSDGKLIIKTEYNPPWVKISFSDNGIGIPSESINHIFEPFFTTKTKGMGMGLTISQRIIQSHGGRIEVNNILPKGTQFSILLPV
jgi:signal transduction histidine kinase